ncbi:hypothetical protein DCAR_0624783 [Daucus carota subsp. sativus]|uniref:Oxidoreductase-like domain-containing protein n=1 Tax=Daucus carota subsp. sativus TaxID=79200 RepID=A0AAF0XE08_DAUCS|nr:hypothetical protein DCAR_0624783 [Daucus carota subsp. sativus]
MIPLHVQTTLQPVHTKSQPLVKIKPPLFHKHDPLGGATADFTMKHINLRRITTHHFSDLSRFRGVFRVSHNKIAPYSIMSDKEKINCQSHSEKTSDNNNNNNNIGGAKEKQVELPPPPEKPLPGDCCGSGCVRCVWDIYYEELDDYNNLVKNIRPGSNSVENDRSSS